MDQNVFVYILASRSRTLYTGVTGNLPARLIWHRRSTTSFVSTYKCARLVWFEGTPSPRAAIEREKQIKKWRRWTKVRLIEYVNPARLEMAEYTLGRTSGPRTHSDRCSGSRAARHGTRGGE